MRRMLRGMAGHIFISHSSLDDGDASRVYEALQRADLDCWIDHEDLRAGQEWDDVVPEVIAASQAVVLVFSRNAKGSKTVKQEMRLADDEDKKILPFCLDDSTFKGFWFRVMAWERRGFPGPFEAELEKFTAELQKLLKPPNGGGNDAGGGERGGERTSEWEMRNRIPKFTGRAQLLEELEARLGDGTGKASVVVIYGPPGFGKTALATEYAYRHREHYRIAGFIPAGEPSTLLATFSSLAPALGLQEDKDQDAAVAAVRARLERSDDWLLILDNAERAEDLEPVMPQVGGGDIVITSQQRGWRGLASAVLPIQELTLDEATGFLVDRTGQEDESGAARLAERLECNPLALEHAGATIDRTQERFSEYLDQLEKDPAGTLSPVLATWKRSFEQVAQESEEAIDLLNLLAFLAPDAIPMKELELPAGAVNVLVAYSHAYRTGDNFLAVHRSVQQLARDRLTEEERTSWLDRAVDVVLEGLPADGSDILTWQRCGLLRPHVEVVRRHAEKIQTEPITLAKLLDRFAVYLRSRALFDEARHAFDEALMLVERTDGADDPLGATIRNHLGALLRDLDDLGGAQAHHEAALAIHERAYGSDHPEVANDLNELGQTLSERGDLAGARDALERAVTIHKKTLGSADRSVAEDLGALFDVLIRSGNVISARQHLEQAAGLYRDLYGPEYPDVALIEYLLDLLSGVEAEPLSEREKLEKLVGVYEKAYDRDHPQVGQLTKLLGDHLLKQGDLEGALHRYERALRIDEDTYRGTHRKVAKDLLRVFSVEAALAKRDAARTALDRAARIFQSAPQTEHQDLPPFLAALDETLENLGQIPAATQEFERVREIVVETYGAASPAAAATLDYLGAELLEAREVAKAKDVLEQALQIFEARHGKEHVRVARCLVRLGSAQRALEKPDLPGAKASLERARLIYRQAGDAYQLQLMNALISLYGVLRALAAGDATRQKRQPIAPDVHMGQLLNEIHDIAGRTMGVDALAGLGRAFRSAGDLEGARKTDERVLDMLEKTYDANHPAVASALNDVGDDLAQLGDLAGARERYERALTIHEAEYGPDHIEVAEDLYGHLFAAQTAVGDLDAAQQSLERALAIFERGNHPSTVEARTYGWLRLGDTALALDGPDGARRLYEAGLTATTAAGEVPGQATFHARLAGLAAARGDRSGATEHLQASARLRLESGSTDPFWQVVHDCSPAIRPGDDHGTLEEALRVLREDPHMQEHMRTFHPSLTASLPEAWFAKESTTLLAPDGQANVIASSEPLDPTIDTDRYAEIQGELLRSEFPGYREIKFEKMEMFGGREGGIRQFEWTPPDNVPITQIQLYYAEDGRGYTATATTPSSHFPAVEVELRQILGGLKIQP